MSGKKNIKILLAYHKPYTMIKSNLFVPIHVGRDIAFEKTKDGLISTKDYKWLLKNTIGDNTGENISKLNRSYCELTAIYWAWKNYDKLGNPDYIGLMHYRTFFYLKEVAKELNLKNELEKFYYNQKFFDKLLDKYDGIISQGLHINKHSKACGLENWENAHNDFIQEDLSFEECAFLKPAINKFIEDRTIYYKNMFVLNKDDFMQYCELLFRLLATLDKYKHCGTELRRMGYEAEGYSSIIFNYLMITKKRKFLEANWFNIPESTNNKIFFKQTLKEQINRIKGFIHK